MTNPGASWVATQLLHWYTIHKRALPWRSTRDPYFIWLAEIIFQQTRIDQGTKYYLSFQRQFPDIHTLANSEDDLVLKMWEGLGYYNRARNLLVTARLISQDFGGVFPNQYSELIKFKGIGEYTAAAISSVCFNEIQAAVDGNVLRVLSRFYSDRTAVDSSPAKKYYRILAQSLIDHDSPGDFNQAMMDLGSGICKPRSPKCDICPLAERCSAFKDGEQMSFPIKVKKIKIRARYLNYFIVQTKGGVFIRKRDASDIWPELFEFPLIEGKVGKEKLRIDFNHKFGLELDALPAAVTKVHLLSHQRLTIQIFRINLSSSDSRNFKDYILSDIENCSTKAFPKPLQNLVFK